MTTPEHPSSYEPQHAANVDPPPQEEPENATHEPVRLEGDARSDPEPDSEGGDAG